MTLESRSSAILRFGVFEVDVRAGEVRKQGVRVKLQEQPFQILTILVQRPGDVVTREELRLAIWPTDTFVDFDNGLNTSINKLREALGDSGFLPIGSLGAGILAEMIGLHRGTQSAGSRNRWEEHTSELQSRFDLVCRLLLEKKKRDAR